MTPNLKFMRGRYTQVKIYIPMLWGVEVTKECNRLGISKPRFIKALIRDYFLRVQGKDLELQREERLFTPPSQAISNDDFSF